MGLNIVVCFFSIIISSLRDFPYACFLRWLLTILKKHSSSVLLNSYKIYSFETKLNAGDVPIKLVVILGKWNSALFHGLSPAGSNNACPRENEDAYLTKILETKPTTFNGIKQAINAMLEFTSTNALSKNEQLAHGYFKIKSK